MRYRIVNKAAFTVAGRKARVPLIYEGENRAISDFVRSIAPEESARIAALSDQEPYGIVAVTAGVSEHRDEGSELDYYHAAITGAEPPDDFDVLAVAAGTWVVFECAGAFPEAAQYLWRDAYADS